jgi:hypothetical protein
MDPSGSGASRCRFLGQSRCAAAALVGCFSPSRVPPPYDIDDGTERYWNKVGDGSEHKYRSHNLGIKRPCGRQRQSERQAGFYDSDLARRHRKSEGETDEQESDESFNPAERALPHANVRNVTSRTTRRELWLTRVAAVNQIHRMCNRPTVQRRTSTAAYPQLGGPALPIIDSARVVSAPILVPTRLARDSLLGVSRGLRRRRR